VFASSILRFFFGDNGGGRDNKKQQQQSTTASSSDAGGNHNNSKDTGAAMTMDASRYPVGVRAAWKALSAVTLQVGKDAAALAAAVASAAASEEGDDVLDAVGVAAAATSASTSAVVVSTEKVMSALSAAAAASASTSTATTATGAASLQHVQIGGVGGQYTTSLLRKCLSASLRRLSELSTAASDEVPDRHLKAVGDWWDEAVEYQAAHADAKSPLLDTMDRKLQSIHLYHARTNSASSNNNKRSYSEISTASGAPAVVTIEDYDLTTAVIRPVLEALQSELLDRNGEETALNKYLDFHEAYEYSLQNMKEPVLKAVAAALSKNAAKTQTYSYVDFLSFLLKGGFDGDATVAGEGSKGGEVGTKGIPESERLEKRYRRHYGRLLDRVRTSVLRYLRWTSPFLDVDAVIASPAVAVLARTWRETGGYEPGGWKSKAEERPMADLLLSLPKYSEDDDGEKRKDVVTGVDLSKYASVDELLAAKAIADGDALKADLARLGLKCGGTVQDRAKRLFATKDKPRDQWPKKIFAKGAANNGDNKAAPNDQSSAPKNDGNGDVGGSNHRIFIAKQQAVVSALLQYVRPTLEATLRRCERRQTQTLQEQERELYEDLYQRSAPAKKRKEGDEEDSDDDDAPIYNPKNVPLDWDGKPIPYWLFKLHGLNHYYDCEICGGESYRGRKNFETHFADQKHALGMKALGIPNTKHFHGVTKIQDAQGLYATLRSKLEKEQFDTTQDEEYEDSHGNVLSRAAYEDLARQGLL